MKGDPAPTPSALRGKPGDAFDLNVAGRLGPAMEELKALGPWSSSRPLIEFYRRHTVIELWVPVS